MLHKSIVNSIELLHMLQDIAKTDNLLYEPDVRNLIQLESIITVKGYIKQSQITFIFEVPLTDNKTYNYFKIYPVPIYNEKRNETTVVVSKYPYLVVKGSTYVLTGSQALQADLCQPPILMCRR